MIRTQYLLGNSSTKKAHFAQFDMNITFAHKNGVSKKQNLCWQHSS
jgi:hypothetical protein